MPRAPAGRIQRERWELAAKLHRILGEDENYEWDRAYVVRKEAREALKHVG